MSDTISNEIQRSMGDNFIMDNAISNEFVCSICKKILINACSGPCGCRYCRQCIGGYLNGEERFCPVGTDDCRDEMMNIDRNILIDQPMDRRIARIVVKCPEGSCQFRDQLRKMGEHMRVCRERASKCPYCSIGCREIRVENDKMSDHLHAEVYSHSVLLAESMNHLTNEMDSLKKDNAELRQENVCLKEEIRLIKANGERNEVAISALTAAIDGMRVNDIAALNEDMVAVGNLTRLIRRDVDALEAGYVNEQASICELREEIVQWQQRWELATTRFGDTERAGQSNRAGMIAMTNDRYPTTNSAATATQEPKANVQSNEKKEIFVEFVWNIKNLSDKMKAAQGTTIQRFISNPFYSHENGYQMCLHMDLVNDVFSFYLCIMRGPFDDKLQWPFNRVVKIAIINPQTKIDNRSITMNFAQKPNNTSLSKPASEKNVPILFFSVMTLDLWVSPLTKNDRLLVKCTVQ